MDERLAVVWDDAPERVRLTTTAGAVRDIRADGALRAMSAESFVSDGGSGRIEFTFAQGAPCRNQVAMVHVEAVERSFTFRPDEWRTVRCLWVPAVGAAVVAAADRRSYREISASQQRPGGLGRIAALNQAPEADFAAEAASCRRLQSPVWLGVSRDVRIFEVGLRGPMQYVDYIQPRFHAHGYFWPEKEYMPGRLGYALGRGWASAEVVAQRLEDGALPILHVTRRDDAVRYEAAFFVVGEKSPLTPATLRGTDYLVADAFSVCHVLTEQQQQRVAQMRAAEMAPDEQTVLCVRVKAVNEGAAPRHAFFKAIFPQDSFGNPAPHGFVPEQGWITAESTGNVMALCRLNGAPMAQEETAVLLAPSGQVEADFIVPHSPLEAPRAQALGRRPVERMHQQCRAFWSAKLDQAARIRLPEERIEEMLYAGLLHCDLITYGREPDAPVAITNGAYSPVSSEVVRITSFYDSMGWHDLARRGLQYYLEKQHSDGFMQNFIGYMLENGCVLWGLGEHYRYTRDDAWVSAIAPQVIRACDYLIAQRQHSYEAGARAPGLLSGQVADPVDPEPNFMLNGYACLGLSRAAEMLADVNAQESARLKAEAEDLKAAIRAALATALARGPVAPMNDGAWTPTAGPWAGNDGPVCLFARPRPCWTHGAMTLRDDLLGPLHLAFQEVLAPDERLTELLLAYHSELLYSEHVSFSQPYYSVHPWLHLRRGEAKPFLKAYYRMLASLADRENYTFWEHYYHESPHKTGDEAQFLMQTRWLLYIEEGADLALLRGAPRAWLADGAEISVAGAASYFGPLSLHVRSRVRAGVIEARISCPGPRRPARVLLRLPHPQGLPAARLDGPGAYEAASETVAITGFDGAAEVRLIFDKA